MRIPHKDGIGGEREGEHSTDNSIEKRNSEIAVFRKHVGHVVGHGMPTEVGSSRIDAKVFMIFGTIETKTFHS